jgi:hypothetical protein
MHSRVLRTDDEYYTPKHAWEDIQRFISKDNVIWEAFRGNGKSAEYLRELGCEVVCDDDDFFACSPKGDIVVSNPPFSKARDALQRLVEWNKPFILILPYAKIFTKYVRDSFEDTICDLKLLVPRKRINFDKPGIVKSKCSFDCFYWCWKVPGMEALPNVVFV